MVASWTAHCLFNRPSSVSAFPSSSFSSNTRRSWAARAVRKAIGSSGVTGLSTSWCWCFGEYTGDGGAPRGEKLEPAGSTGKESERRVRGRDRERLRGASGGVILPFPVPGRGRAVGGGERGPRFISRPCMDEISSIVNIRLFRWSCEVKFCTHWMGRRGEG